MELKFKISCSLSRSFIYCLSLLDTLKLFAFFITIWFLWSLYRYTAFLNQLKVIFIEVVILFLLSLFSPLSILFTMHVPLQFFLQFIGNKSIFGIILIKDRIFFLL